MRYYSSTAVAATLTAPVTDSATTMNVSATTGWPTSYPFTVILDQDEAEEELVDVTAVGGLSCTITRSVDGSTAHAHDAGATARHGSSGRDLREPQQHIAAVSGVHGVTGSVVGTTDVQTVTNKTFTTPTIGSFLNAAHDHTNAAGGGNIPQASITNLSTTLSGKSDTGHAHVESDVTGLAAALSGKSDTSHTHDAANITVIGGAIDSTLNAYTDFVDGLYYDGSTSTCTASSTTAVSNNTFTTVTFDGVALPDNLSYSGGTFTALANTTFLVTVTAVWTSNTTGGRGLRLRKNGVAEPLTTIVGGNTSTAVCAVTHTAQVALLSGGYFTIERYQNSGGSLAPSTSMTGYGAAAVITQLGSAT